MALERARAAVIGSRPYKLAVFMGGAWQQVSYAYRKNRDDRARGYKRVGIEVRMWDVRRLPKA